MPSAPAPTRRQRRSRAERREKLQRPGRGRAAAPAIEVHRPLVRASSILWWVTGAVLLGLTAGAVGHKITWYLAVDQFGYLTFAHDLIHGHVFHHWPPIDAVARELPERVDVLVQTYVYDRGRLYCRYAPGFAMILAGWLALFGDDGAHYLNPTVFLALLVLALAFQARVFRDRWRAMVGVGILVALSGTTFVFFWALTLVRDLATHLTGLLGLYLLLPVRGRPLTPRRTLAAGVALGFAASMRPDAILYSVPGAVLAAMRWFRERLPRQAVATAMAAGALGLLVGLAPFLAYNWAATGNPLRPTQGMEVDFLSEAPPPPPAAPGQRVGYASAPWIGGTAMPVQGGGLRLANLRHVLPVNVAQIRDAYGDPLVALAILGAIVALVQRSALFVATVPYSVLALLLYSCWSKADPRYFSGVHVLLPMLIVEGAVGTLDVARKIWRLGFGTTARGIAASFAAVLLGVAVWTLRSGVGMRVPIPTLTLIVTGIVGLGALAVATWPGRRVTAVVAPVLALAVVWLAGQRAWTGMASRATFQRGEMVRARTTFNAAVEPGAVVITTEAVGRPAENIEYYSGVARALYLTDLLRWRMAVWRAAELLQQGGLKPYLFIPTNHPGRAALLTTLARKFDVQLVRDVPPRQAIDYFVAAAFHRGLEMELYKLAPQRTP